MSNRKSNPVPQIVMPSWLLRIWEFDGLEIHPCAVVGFGGMHDEIVEICHPEEADFWTVFGHYRRGGIDDFRDFGTEAEAQAFHDELISVFPHLAGED